MIAGRDFTWSDLYDKNLVAIVSENLAREEWGSPQNALGKRIRVASVDDWRESGWRRRRCSRRRPE